MRRWLQLAAVLIAARAVMMCASNDDGEPVRPGFNDPPGNNGGSSGQPAEAGPFVEPDAEKACEGIQCKIPTCAAGTTTSISGTVYAPNGTLPLYNVVVYIPSAPVEPLPRGLTCDRCGTLVTGKPVAATLTDTKGHFELKDVPAGADIPLVMQIGKWRRQITLPKVEACKDNLADPADTETDPRFKFSEVTRLPRKREEGDMPRIAVTSGQCDLIPCLLPKLGIDASEYGGGFSAKAVNFYRGANGSGPGLSGASSPLAASLWGDPASLRQYDLVLHSCECEEHPENKGAAVWENMKNYVDQGGRLFTTDYGYTFIQNAPTPWSGVATWDTDPDASKPALDGGSFPVNQGFPKGKALVEWLDFTNGAAGAGNVLLPEVFKNAVSLEATHATSWVSEPPEGTPKVFSFNAPVGAKPEAQCGRVAFGDAHIFSQMENFISTNFPSGCNPKLNDREKVMAFLFFDLTACVISDLVPQKPPEIIK